MKALHDFKMRKIATFLAFFLANVANSRYVQDVDTFSSSCGHFRKSRVIGGDPVEIGEFPWIASVQTLKGQHFCGGFLISNRYLISAAHCYRTAFNNRIAYNEDGSANVNSIKVAVNRVKLSDNSDPTKVIEVKRLIMHPEFEERLLNNDIAILELNQDLQTEKDMYPICLPQGQDEIEGSVVVAGWGSRQCGTFQLSNELHKVEIPLWKTDDCQKAYQDADYVFNSRKDYVCAGSDGKDIYQGDSGGPLMFLNPEKRWTAVGIVSSGALMCSDRVPGVYTRVSNFLPWIQSVIS